MNGHFLAQPRGWIAGGLLGIGWLLLVMPFYTIDRLRGVGIATLSLLLIFALLSRRETRAAVWRQLGAIAMRRGLSAALVGLVAALVAMVLSWSRPPVPQVHDEFSYLLAADTLAAGRLTNPPHPLAEHFETFHVLSHPTRTSKYPIGQGLVLAFGQVVTGHPIVGVWLSFAIASAALCWMLQAWLPPRWALLGGMYVAVHPFFQGGFWFVRESLERFLSLTPPDLRQHISFSWSQSFWGGAVAMLGGCLVYGVLPRFLRSPTDVQAGVLGLGLVLLAHSRPFEGAISSLPAGLALGVWILRQWRSGGSLAAIGQVLWPCAAVLCAGLAGTMVYNQAVTGSPTQMPYVVYSQQYDTSPMFFFQPRRENITPPNAIFERFEIEYVNPHYDEKQTLGGWLKSRPQMTLIPLAPFFWPIMPVLLWIPAALRSRKTRAATAVVAVLILAQQTVIGSQPHYLAPVTGLILVTGLDCLRQLSVLRLGERRVGRALALALLALTPILLAELAVARVPPRGWCYDRARIETELSATGTRHLILVRYSPQHNVFAEWVYNAAAIDESPVIWARELEPDQNHRLIGYYHDRQIWLLEADETPPRLHPYSVGDSGAP